MVNRNGAAVNLPPYAKALIGGLAAGVSFAIPVVDDGLVWSEILGIVGAFLAGTGLVYAVPNGPQDIESR